MDLKSDWLTLRSLRDRAEAINANRVRTRWPILPTESGTGVGLRCDDFLGDPGFWARLIGPGPSYSYVEVEGDGPAGWRDVEGGRTGEGAEVRGRTGLGGKRAWIPNLPGDSGRFLWHVKGTSCVRTICAGAYSLADACEEMAADDPTCGPLHGAMEGVAVEVVRLWYDGPNTARVAHEEPFASDFTGPDGRVCFPVPDAIPDPTAAPVVDPAGGGATGGTLVAATYRATYAHENRWGLTAPAPDSPEFQVGIPDPSSYPTLPAPGVGETIPAADGALQPGTYVARHVFRGADGGHNRPSTTSAVFTVAEIGDVPVVSLPALSGRPNASTIDLYLAAYNDDDEDGGTFRLYRADAGPGAVHLDTEFDPTATLAPGTNTSSRSVPRVWYTPAALADSTRVYARRLDAAGAFAACQWKAGVGGEADLGGALGSGCPPARNATWMGDYRIKVRPEECNTQTAVRTINGVNCPPPFEPGFCCFAHDVEAVDFDTGAPVDARWRCSNPDACTDEEGTPLVNATGGMGGGSPGTPTFNAGHSEFVGPCLPNPLPCPAPDPAPVPDYPCDLARYGAGTDPNLIGAAAHLHEARPITVCFAEADGYYGSEAVCIPAPCGVPGVRTEAPAPVKLYSAANWVYVPTCCADPPCFVPPVRRKGMFPRVVYAHVDAPEPITGGVQGWTLPYIGAFPGGGPFVDVVWGTGCIGGTGGYGAAPSCLPMNPPIGNTNDLRGWCDRPFGSPPDCYPYAEGHPGRLFPQRFQRDRKVFYGGSRIAWTVRVWTPLGMPYFCEAFFTWENFWNGGCHFDDPAPLVRAAEGYCPDLYAVKAWMGEEDPCPCGRDAINDDWLAGSMYPTGGFSVGRRWDEGDCVPLEWTSSGDVASVTVVE